VLRAADLDPLIVRGPLGAAVERELAADSRGPGHNVPADTIALALEQLAQEGVLKTREERDHRDVDARFDRQARYAVQEGLSAVDVHERLAASSVLMLGLGGAGGAIAEHLVRFGVGKLIVADGGHVARENMGRQSLYTPADCGRTKAAAATDRLRSIASGSTEIVPLHTMIDSTTSIVSICADEHPTFAVLAADAPQISIRTWMFEAARTTGVPYIWGGQALPYLYAGPLVVPDSNPCSHCARGIDPAIDALLVEAMDRHPFAMPALGSVDSMVAALMATEIFHWLTGVQTPATLDRCLTFDIRTFASTIETLECSACAPAAGREHDEVDGTPHAA
jgi:molybdopterin/thiamine biosynthesis adenylyltransferase